MAGDYQIENGILKRYTGREETIEIPEGIHTIGEGALKGCVSLKRAVLPPGLQSIEEDAFKGCRRLEEVVIPDGTACIGRYAFHRCHALQRVLLPPSVQELGEYAFLYCDSLREAQLPGVKRLGTAALANGISLEKLVISRELEPDCICDVFTGCGRVREIAFPDGETYDIPNVVEAAAGTFPLPPLMALIVKDILLRMMEWEDRTLVRFRVNIKHVEVPEGIEVLAKSSFFDMRGIQDIKLPKSLKRIESRAFRNCIGLEQVIFGGDEVWMDPEAFRNCTALRSVRTCDGTEYRFRGLSQIYRVKPGGIPANGGTPQKEWLLAAGLLEPVRAIHRQVLGNFRISKTILLQYLGAESRVIIPEGVTRIAAEAFAGNETIDRVIFPESLREIGAEAFRGCLLLQTVVLPKELCKIDAGAFEGCVKLLRMEIPQAVDVLEDRLFRQCRALQEVGLPQGLRRIGESAFYGCQNLKKIALPENLTGIGKMAFYRCGLREIRIPAKTEYVESLAFAKSSVQRVWISGGGYETGKNYGADVFGDCARLKTMVLDQGVRHIPDKFAYGCTGLVRVIWPDTLESVGRHVWEGSRFLEEWRQRQKEAPCEEESQDAVFWDGQHLEGEIRIPAHVRILAGGAFYGNTRITKVDLPPALRAVGPAAFKGCTALRQVFFPSGISDLNAEVFSGCRALREVLAGGERESSMLPVWRRIGDRAFYHCENLQNIRLDQTEEVGREAFRGCTALGKCAINPAIRAGESAFAGTALGERLENGLFIAGNQIVSGEDCFGDLSIPDGIQSIAPYAFAGNRSLGNVTFPQSLVRIGEGAFFGCSGLLSVAFSEGLRQIGAHAFEKCSSLQEVECSVAAIGEAAFCGCSALVRACFSGVKILNKRLLVGCIRLKACLCESVEEVREFCFSGCRNLQSFDFASLKQAGKYAFSGCESLSYAEFQDGLCLNAHALEDCSSLEKICLSGPDGAVVLKEYALSGCTALDRVVYQGREWVFEQYADLFSEELPETVSLLFYSAFSCFTVEHEENLVRYRGAAAKVRIPEGIRRIEAEAFRDVMMLEKIEIPKSVEYIGARAFHGTGWMAQKRRESPLVTVRDMLLDASGCEKTVEIPEGIRLVCGWAFANGLEIRSIHFLSERVRVEEYAFRNCIHLQEMILPDGTHIHFSGLEDRKKEWPPLAKQAVTESLNCFKTNGEGVLIECTGNISRLRLANGITEIGEGVFQDGNLLTEVTFCETVKKIGKRAFAGCKWLSEVRGACHVEQIEAYAFSCCGALRLVELSENLRRIGAGAFENCTSLEEIRIPKGVEEIPERAFYRCQSLKHIRLPSTIKRIGREAFAFCGKDLVIEAPEGVRIERQEERDALPKIGEYRI